MKAFNVNIYSILFTSISFFLSYNTAWTQSTDLYDLVITNGRVIDPETQLDAIRNIGIRNGRIVEITSVTIRGKETIDADGLVVAPGFIDLHVHGRDNTEQEYQAHDGVTTALELEWGIEFLDKWYASRKNSALINYGASVNWPFERFLTFGKLSENIDQLRQSATDGKVNIQTLLGQLTPSFRAAATDEQITATRDNIRKALESGGIGIGIPIAYLPGAHPKEVYRIYELASELDVPVFSHVRDNGITAVQQAISDAVLTGAQLHIVHLNSMTLGDIEIGIEMVASAQEKGFPITAEVYPYTAASTDIASAIFDEGWQEKRGISYGDLQWVATGERLTEETFNQYRKEGGAVIIHMMKPEWIKKGVASPNTIIASDGMPYSPLAHPRTAGTFSRVLGKYVREEKALDLNSAIKKMTLLPAQVLENIAPMMRFKGRLQIGADADITIFNADEIRDLATFEEGLKFSAGIYHVIVNGQAVIRDKETVSGVFPGQPVFGKYKQ